MQKIVNLYQTSQENLYKAACQLLSKCYKEGLRTLVVVQDEEKSQMLDNLLWSFAQKDFIPHALIDDAQFDDHPIIIGHASADYSKLDLTGFNTLVLIESFENNFASFEKTIVFFTQNDQDKALKLGVPSSKHYVQDDKGQWGMYIANPR